MATTNNSPSKPSTRRKKPIVELQSSGSRRRSSIPGQKTTARSRAGVGKPAHVATSAGKQPPVLARNYNLDASGFVMPGLKTPKRDQKYSKNARRRFDVALGAPGAEMRLPYLPSIHFSLRYLSILILAVLLGGIYYLWNSPTFRVSSIELDGINRVNSEEVNAVLSVSGKPVFLVNPEALKAELEAAFPEFSSISVQVSLPAQVNVNVVERSPVLTWKQENRIQLVDREGFIFPLRLEAAGVITPVVEALGNPPGLAASPADLAALVLSTAANEAGEATNQAQADDTEAPKPFLSSQMVTAIMEMAKIAPTGAGLVYDPAHGLGWRDERGWQVYLGEPKEITEKLLVYQALVQSLLDKGIQPELVSVEYVNNPYYRPAKEQPE